MSKPQPIVTAESLENMILAAIATNPEQLQHIVGRALVVLFNRQTQAEQNVNQTNDHNGIGFASCDARSGTLSAKSYIKRRALEQWQIDRWIRTQKNGKPRICKYHKQLNEAAVEKATNKILALQ